jgi:hypothetical protein
MLKTAMLSLQKVCVATTVKTLTLTRQARMHSSYPQYIIFSTHHRDELTPDDPRHP